MINQHVAYYLGSKAIAALLNLGTMALFVRLGGAETYGAYVVALALAGIVYAVTMQWLRFSFFACYREESGPNLIATYLWLVAAGSAALAAFAAGLVGIGAITPTIAIAMLCLTTGLALYDALHEMSRTRLQARAVAVGVLARAALMLVLGVAALKLYGTAFALALAVALAHALAALPMLLSLRGMLGGAWSRAAAAELFGYGGPLVPAYGLDGVGLQLDRLLLAKFGTLGMVGSYGAVADLVRQLMIVVSEAISGAYMAIARAELVAGREEAAVKVLGQAFLAYTALATFGAASILRFEGLVLDTLFGSDIRQAIEPAILLIVASSVGLVFRSYYFGQVLYLTGNPGLLVRSNGVHCAVMVVLGLALTPTQGAYGVATALTVAHLCGCLVYVLAWRNSFVMRLPYGKAAVIVGLGLSAYLATGIVEAVLQWRMFGAVVNLVLLVLAAIVAARLFNLLSFNDLVAAVRRGVAERRGPKSS